MQRPLLLLLALGLPIALAGCTGSGDTGTFEGRVLDRDTNEPIRGAEVKVTSGPDSSKRTTTDGDGRYSLELAPGTWSLKATAPGYVEADAKDLGLAAGDRLSKDFFLAKSK